MNRKHKVLVAMSGGVDSSVAAALLLRDGYDVAGAFMVHYNDKQNEINRQNIECWLPDYRDALRVAAKLGISLLRLDFTKEYKDLVLEYMFKEYSVGRTPNPDVMCNKFIKFGVWLKKAREMGFDYLATGHYARLGREIQNSKKQNPNVKNKTDIKLLKAKDENKDQTYFLHQLNQAQLSKVMFPIGDNLKSEVRDLARKCSLPTAEKEESMGICFVGEVPMKEFLRGKVKAKEGDMVTSDGVVIGRHEGLAFYTIGEKIGVESQKSIKSVKSPVTKNQESFYVFDKDIKKNMLIVGFMDDPKFYKSEAYVDNVNWVAGRAPKFPLQCQVRLRHRQLLQNVKIKMEKSKLLVSFDNPQKAITPGQFAVFYLDDVCLGGGTIK